MAGSTIPKKIMESGESAILTVRIALGMMCQWQSWASYVFSSSHCSSFVTNCQFRRNRSSPKVLSNSLIDWRSPSSGSTLLLQFALALKSLWNRMPLGWDERTSKPVGLSKLNFSFSLPFGYYGLFSSPKMRLMPTVLKSILFPSWSLFVPCEYPHCWTR